MKRMVTAMSTKMPKASKTSMKRTMSADKPMSNPVKLIKKAGVPKKPSNKPMVRKGY